MAASFLAGYELANDSVKRFREEFPTGRTETKIDIDLSDLSQGFVLIYGYVYRDINDPFPAASGIAHGDKSTYGESMKKWYIEDTETSAIARAIKTLTPTLERASYEDMVKVETYTTPLKVSTISAVPDMPVASFEMTTTRDPWTISQALTAIDGSIGLAQPPEAPTCVHGHMKYTEGVSKTTGKPYRGHVCVAPRGSQCSARWEN